MAKVVVAMSGGVDSSVAAALLKQAGGDELRSSSRFANARVFDVVGVFMKLADLPNFKKSEKRARKIAKILKIPFLVLDLRKKFKKMVIDYFLKEYKTGLTPNPCVICNKEIKFGLLLEKALKLDADFIATGHYAQTNSIHSIRQEIAMAEIRRMEPVKLLVAKDKNKDQSYFLWMLNQKQLKRVLFPIGDYTRKEVEGLAKRFKLPVLGIKKSVEICFVKTTINDFLKRYLKPNPGQIIYSTPEVRYRVIGRHQGLAFYTIGQRKGIGLPKGPYYVLGKDLKKNTLIVTKNQKDLLKKELIAKKINWISGKKPELPIKIKSKIRYRHKLATATIKQFSRGKIKVVFEKPQRAITPGQSVVFYLPRRQAGAGEELLGGGIIC